MFLIKSSNYSIWLPIYTLDDASYNSYFYQGLLVFELILSIFALIFCGVSGYVMVTTRSFHFHFNTLLAIIVLSWVTSAIGKSLLTPYSTGALRLNNASTDLHKPYWTDDVARMVHVEDIGEAWPLFVGGVLTWYYMMMMSTCIFVVSLERLCAVYFIENYENLPRIYLLFFLIIFQQFLIITAVYFLFYNRLKFIPAVTLLTVLNVLAFTICLLIQRYNLKIMRQFGQKPAKNLRAGNFTLSVRFQAKENLRVFEVGENFYEKNLFFFKFFSPKKIKKCGGFLNF